MTKSEALSENLEKAQASATFLCDELRIAIADASPLECLVLFDLLKDAAKIESRVKSLIEARKADGVK